MIQIKSNRINKDILYSNIEQREKKCEKAMQSKPPKAFQSNKQKKEAYNTTYVLGNFVFYEDKYFLENLYKKVLKRPIDSEALQHYLGKLRSGEMTKTEIICSVRFSSEGKAAGVEILGIKKRAWMLYLKQLPVVGYLFRVFFAVALLPRYMRLLNQFMSKEYLVEEELKQKLLSLQEITKEQEQKFQHELHTFQEKYNSDILSLKDSFSQAILSFNTSFENLSKAFENQKLQNGVFAKDILAKEKDRYLDHFYVLFEQYFRGEKEVIKKRQSYYLPFVKEVFKKGDRVLDIGCGRGEWLELMRENEIYAQGVDLNSIMIKEGIAQDLNVQEKDALEFLKECDNDSFAIISAFHIVEHLPFEVLMQLIAQMYRVLRPEGMIILETPNPENILVGSCSFYTDPTHRNPIPPSSLEFLVKYHNFSSTTIHRLHPLFPSPLREEKLSREIALLEESVCKAQDYSVIGYKHV